MVFINQLIINIMSFQIPLPAFSGQAAQVLTSRTTWATPVSLLGYLGSSQVIPLTPPEKSGQAVKGGISLRD